MTPPVTRAEPPVVSIGIPVYNGGKTLAAALESVLSQDYPHLDILISDNASTDDTRAICERFQARDSRIRYVRQKENIGAAPNFLYVLQNARGPYFMWAAADDVRSSNFVTVNAAFLHEHPEYVASTSPVRFENGGLDPVVMGDGGLEQSTPEARVLAFFTRWHANGRFYSLFRREALLSARAFGGPTFLASDWVLMLEMARLGKFHRSTAGSVVLGVQGASHDPHIFRKFRTTWVEHLVPLWRFGGRTWKLSQDFSARARTRIALIILELNLRCWVERFRRHWKKPAA